MRFPTREDVVRLNRRHIGATGGIFVEPDNLMKGDSLEWVLNAVQYPLFSTEPYPTLVEKAAMLAWVIIKDHVFYDGCKRTGMSALESLIRANDYRLDASNEEMLEVALRIAGAHPEEEYSFDEFVRWIRSKIALRTTDT